MFRGYRPREFHLPGFTSVVVLLLLLSALFWQPPSFAAPLTRPLIDPEPATLAPMGAASTATPLVTPPALSPERRPLRVRHPQLLDASVVLAPFDQGLATTAVIVNLQPSREGDSLADRSRLSSHVLVAGELTSVTVYYDLLDEHLRHALRANVSETIDQVLGSLDLHGLTLTRRFSYQYGFAAQVTAAALERLLAHPEVVKVESDRPLSLPTLPAPAPQATGSASNGVLRSAPSMALVPPVLAEGAPPATMAALISQWEALIDQLDAEGDPPVPILATGLGGQPNAGPGPCDAQLPALAQAAVNAHAAGISLFAPAGDEGDCSALSWPACLSAVNAVGAVYAADQGLVGWCVNAASCAAKTPDDTCASGYLALEAAVADEVPAASNSTAGLALLAPADPALTQEGTLAATAAALAAATALQQQAWDRTGTYLTPAEVSRLLQDSGAPITDTKSGITTPRLDSSQSLAFLVDLIGANSTYPQGLASDRSLFSDPALESDWVVASPAVQATAVASELPATANTSASCPPDDYVDLANQHVTDTRLYQACQTLAAGPFTVGATANVTFEAGQRITLRPGFQVERGGVLTARVPTTLSPSPGGLQVTLGPSEAIAAGAQWRLLDSPTWRDSAFTETGLPVGDYTVELKALEGWVAPQQTGVTIASAATYQLDRIYSPAFNADLLFDGFEGRTLTHPIIVSHSYEEEPAWGYQILDGPASLRFVNENLLAYDAPWGSGGTSLDYRVRITHQGSGVSRDISGRITIMSADVVVQGIIGAAGGELFDPVTGIRLVVPPGTVATDTLFMVVRGIGQGGATHFTVHTEPAEVQLLNPLELTIPTNTPQTDLELSDLAEPLVAATESDFSSPPWTRWRWPDDDDEKAILLDSNNSLARNRVPPGKICEVYTGFINTFSGILPIPQPTRCIPDFVRRLSSLCGPMDSFVSSHCLGKPPVLFVHGYQRFADLLGEGVDEGILKGGDDYWNELPSKLNDAGFAVFGFQWRTSQRFQDAAADLATAVASIHQTTGRHPHIIAHSFGGLLARTYLQGFATGKPYQNNVASLVTIGAPHSGIADEGVFDGIRLPDGRSQRGWVIPFCHQLSCYQAGRAPQDTYQVLNGFSLYDLRDLFGVDPDQPGEIPVRLAESSRDMPVPMLALYGLTSMVTRPGIVIGNCVDFVERFDDGDGLISWDGQRVHPKLSCPDAQTKCESTAIGSADHSDLFPAGIVEKALLDSRSTPLVEESEGQLYPQSLSATPMAASPTVGLSVKPGYEQTIKRYCYIYPSSSPTKHGYRHSPNTDSWGAYEQLGITASSYANHPAYQEILAWLTPTVPVDGTEPLNDTGIDWCADETTNFLPCPVEGYPGQDGQEGRDATHNDDSDGHAGFSFTKISNSGNPLPNSAVLGSGPNDWACTRDNVTGLIWEVKTDDGGLRDMGWTYSWYNPDPATNGGFEGYADDGNICFNPARCDTDKFVMDVNAQGLCGAADWRLPDRFELESITSIDRWVPAIDSTFFPNTGSSDFWSSSPYADYSGNAWRVNFYNGWANYSAKFSAEHLRLVRVGQ